MKKNLLLLLVIGSVSQIVASDNVEEPISPAAAAAELAPEVATPVTPEEAAAELAPAPETVEIAEAVAQLSVADSSADDDDDTVIGDSSAPAASEDVSL